MLILEVISIFFMALKLVDFSRKLRIVNIILLVCEESKQYILIFIITFLMLNLILVPLAQSICGIHLYGYKTFEHAVTSVLMVNYAKGNLNVMLDYNAFWSIIFLFLYYLNISFLMHAAFHSVQTFSLIRTSIRVGLSDQNDPFVKEEREEVVDLKKM